MTKGIGSIDKLLDWSDLLYWYFVVRLFCDTSFNSVVVTKKVSASAKLHADFTGQVAADAVQFIGLVYRKTGDGEAFCRPWVAK